MADSPRRRLPVIAILAIGISMLACWPAAAATVTLKPCSATNQSGWGLGYAANAWKLFNECPTGFTLLADGSTTATQQFYFPRTQRNGLKIKSASATLKGSGGAAAGKRQGMAVSGGTIYPLDGADVANPTTITWGGPGNPTLPNAFAALLVHGKCVETTPCPISEGMNVSNVSVSYDDLNAPTIAVPGWDFVSESKPYIPKVSSGQWNNGARSFSWGGADYTQSGIAFSTMRVNGGVATVFDTGCGANAGVNPSFVDFCPTQYGWERFVTPEDSLWSQGANTVNFTIHDMAMNQASATLSFKYDTVAPDPPQYPYLETAFDQGWQAVNNFDVAWYNIGDQQETAQESGIHLVDYQLLQNGASVMSGSVSESGVSSLLDFEVPYEGIWDLALRTRDRAGNASDWAYVQLNYETLVLAVPEIDPVGWINRADMIAGVPIVWHRPANTGDSQAGVCGYAYALDADETGSPGTDINTPAYISQIDFRQLLEDGRHHVYLRAVSCAGVPGEIAVLPVDVDLTKPSVTLKPSDGAWRSGSQPVMLEARDDGSGADHIDYSIDGGPPQSAAGDSVELSVGGGHHTVEFSAVDIAGNRSKLETGAVFVDDDSPEGAIAPFDASRPTLITATVADRESGIASAWLEYIPLDGGGAAQFSRTVTPDPGTRDLKVSGRLPATQMGPGRYRVQVVSTDRVGNRSVIGLHGDGNDAVVTAPLLKSPSLNAGFKQQPSAADCRKSPKTPGCPRAKSQSGVRTVGREVVRFGHGALLAGSLTLPDGTPVAGARLAVVTRVAGSPAAVPAGEATTGADGRFELRIPPGPTRQVEVQYAGSETESTAMARATLITQGRATLAVTPRDVVTGREFTIKGRVLGADAGLPRRGKAIAFEYRTRDGWALFPAEAQTLSDGSFRVTRSLDGLRRSVRFRLRAKLKAEDGWPYATGYSRAITLVVRKR